MTDTVAGLRVAYVYPNPRAALAEAAAAGAAPDTKLLGQNHLARLGVDARIVDSALRRGTRRDGAVHRLTWNLRELTLPWEVGDADIVFTALANALPLAARLRRRVSVVLLSYHLLMLHERLGRTRRALLERSVRSAAGVVCISQAAAAQLTHRYGLQAERVRVARLGVDAGFWPSQPPVEDGYVLSVGRDLARDYATLFEAVRNLPVKTVVAAKRENVAGLSIPPNVHVRLDISAAEVRELYAGAACVVVPITSRGGIGTEGSGVSALLEAMASSRCAIVTDSPFLRDYVQDRETALLVPADDPVSLRTAIEGVLGDGGRAASIGARARAAVEASLTTAHLAASLAPAFADFAAR
jgi:glycosyltransferase involved in cell wall biosynthesis